MNSATSTNRRSIALAGAGIAAGSVVLFTAIALWFYNWRPTVGTVILGLGWMALVGSAALLLRAALNFDFTREVDMAEALSDKRKLELEREKKLLLKAIKEIEFDLGMGKIDDAEAAPTIERYRARALEIMRQLDVKEDAQGYEEQVEKEVARRLAKVKQQAEAPRAVPVCVTCGQKNDVDAEFCKKCGKKIGGS